MLRKKIYSIVFNKCPRCHKGHFFIGNNPYKLKEFDKMNKSCPECGLDFERETGFYYGAMYVSYGFSVALGVGLYLFLITLLKLDPLRFFLPTYSLLILILLPVTYRLARLTWINLFIRYQKENNS